MALDGLMLGGNFGAVKQNDPCPIASLWVPRIMPKGFPFGSRNLYREILVNVETLGSPFADWNAVPWLGLAKGELASLIGAFRYQNLGPACSE